MKVQKEQCVVENLLELSALKPDYLILTLLVLFLMDVN
jgi:hypothetical protein